MDLEWSTPGERPDVTVDANHKQIRLHAAFLRQFNPNPGAMFSGPTHIRIGLASHKKKRYLVLAPAQDGVGSKVTYAGGSTGMLAFARALKQLGAKVKPGSHGHKVEVIDGVWLIDCLA
jgi:hypothetical protein